MFTIRKSLLSVSVFSICLFPAISALAKDNYCYINGSGVNVRTAPSVKASIAGKLSNQKVVLEKRSGDWYEISFNKMDGWVKKDFVSLEPSPSKVISSSTSSKSNSSNQIKVAVLRGDSVNVRSKPNVTSSIVTKLSKKKVQIVGSSGEWYKISYNGTVGWVKDDFIAVQKASTSETSEVSSIKNKVTTATAKKPTSKSIATKTTTAYINGNNVNLRANPSKSSNIVTKLSNTKVTVLSQSGDWRKVSTGKYTGWVLKDFISSSLSKATSSTKTSAESSQSTSIRNRMVLYSRGFIGVSYRYGGTSPRGFDCSGFTSYIYKRFGIDINRTSNAQAQQGKYVPKNKLQPGDLVFFDTNGGKTKVVNHAGMYIGNGKFIHASSSRKDAHVRVSSLNESFYAKAYVTGRCFIK